MKISEAAKNAAQELKRARIGDVQWIPDDTEKSASIIQSAIDSETKRFSDQLIETTAEVFACREAMKSDDAVICDLECENATLKRKNAELVQALKALLKAADEADLDWAGALVRQQAKDALKKAGV